MKVIRNYNQLEDLCELECINYRTSNLNEAYQFCQKITINHYENFPVGSILIPKKNRKYFYSIYAFSRIADDIADELTEYSASARTDLLLKLKNSLSILILADNITNPIFLSLKDTIIEKKIDISLFNKLIDAFVSDSNFSIPNKWEDIEDYCQLSANPIGQLVLTLFDELNENTKFYSDKICTGLQLVNFWQDLSIDMKNGRYYIPNELLKKYGLTKVNLVNDKNSVNFANCRNDIFARTLKYFKDGQVLVKILKNYRLKFEIAITIESGLVMLSKIKNLGDDILTIRPKLNKFDFITILFRSLKAVF